MEELAKDLQAILKDFDGCTVETGIDEMFVYRENNVISSYLAMTIFFFAKVHSLGCFIGVSIQGHIRFVLYED